MDFDYQKTELYKNLRHEIKILEHLLEYYVTGTTYDELELKEVSLLELIGYMRSRNWPSNKDPLDRRRMIKKIEEKISTLKRKLNMMQAEEIKKKNLNMMLIINSWTKLINATSKGFYLGKAVGNIRRDTVIILTDSAFEYKEINEEENVLIFGPGIYFTTFSLMANPNMHITDYRPINGLLITKEILDKMYNAPPIYESDTVNLIINELMATVPFDLILKPTHTRAYIKGILTRNVFLKIKEVLNALQDLCKDPTQYTQEKGFSILSYTRLYPNRLLVSGSYEKMNKYKLMIAGVGAAQPTADKIIKEIFTDEFMLEERFEMFQKIKREYINLGQRILFEWL